MKGEKRIVVAWLSVCRWGVGDCVGEELYPFWIVRTGQMKLCVFT